MNWSRTATAHTCNPNTITPPPSPKIAVPLNCLSSAYTVQIGKGNARVMHG
ncbi:MAG: hypothetical protein ACQUHE_01450 [Bacteroidia bacterium]